MKASCRSRISPSVGEALDGLDAGAVEASGQYQAAAHDAAVDAHRARPADAVLATGVRAQQAELEAEKIDEVLARLDASRRRPRR